MKIRINRKDAIWSYIGTALSMGANLLILPFILVFLSDDAIALYYIFTNLSAIATLFDFGFSPSIARSMAYAWSGAKSIEATGVGEINEDGPNYLLMSKLVSTCKIIYFAIAMVALILSLTAGTFYVSFVTRANEQPEVMISWLIYAVAIFLNILFSYYSVFLRGVGAVAKINIATIVARLVQIVLCVALLFVGMGLIGVAVAYLAYGFIFRFLANIWFYKYEGIGEKLKENKALVSRDDIVNLIKAMWPNTWRDGLVTLSNYLLNQATTIIASIYLSLQQTGVYSLCVQLTTAIATVAVTMYTAYQPALQSAYANRDTQTQRKYMSIVMVTFDAVFLLGMAALVIIGVPFIQWLNPNYVISIPMLIGVGLCQFVLKYRDCYTSFISTTNRIIYTKAFVVSALICVGLSLLLSGVFHMQALGLIIAQLVSQIVYNAWHWPRLVHKELGMSVSSIIPDGIDGIKDLIFNRRREA